MIEYRVSKDSGLYRLNNGIPEQYNFTNREWYFDDNENVFLWGEYVTISKELANEIIFIGFKENLYYKIVNGKFENK